MGLHQIKKLLHSKRNSQQSEETPRKWGRLFASYSSDRGLASRIYNKLKKLNTKITMQSISGQMH
jgi:hypothetical protein